MTCPTCRASNPPGAVFCGQCYTRFDASEPELAAPQVLDGAGGSSSPERREPTRTGTGGTATVGRFTAVDGQLVWSCAVCGTENEVEAFACGVCGTRMDAEADRAAAVDWPAARRAEALAPGLGHLRAGHAGMGVARMAMVVLWLLGALVLALGGATGIATAVPLVVGAAVVWATGPGDVDALRTGREPRLDPRGFMYVVIGVTLGVIVTGGLALVL